MMLRDELIDAIAPLTSHPHLLLDRLLDVLEANAGQWQQQAFRDRASIVEQVAAKGLIAVLRPPVSSSQENP